MPTNSIAELVENHVIVSKIYDWDSEGLAEHINAVNDHVNKSTRPLVHTLWDFRDMASYPTNLNDIRKAIQPLFTNKRLGWVITVMQNPMVSFLSQAASSMYGVRYRTFKTMDEAINFLQSHDPTLPELKDFS